MTKRVVSNFFNRLNFRVSNEFDREQPTAFLGRNLSWVLHANAAMSDHVYQIQRYELQDPDTNAEIITEYLNNYGHVRLPYGVIELSTPILLGTGQALMGVSGNKFRPGTVIKPASGYNGHLVRSANYNEACILQSVISDLYFDGSDTTLTAISLYCRECVVYNVHVSACYTYGIEIKGLNTNPATGLALNNHIFNTRMFPGSQARFYVNVFEDYFTADNTVIECYLEGATEALVESRGANFRLQNSHLYDSDKNLVILRDSGEKLITDNYLENCQREAILIISGGTQKDFIISNNILRNIRRDEPALNTPDAVVVADTPAIESLVITNNIVRRDNSSYRAPQDLFSGIASSSHSIHSNEWDMGVVQAIKPKVQTVLAVNEVIDHLSANTKVVYTGTDALELDLPHPALVGDTITFINFSGQTIDFLVGDGTINDGTADFSTSSKHIELVVDSPNNWRIMNID